jgi:uncharacterized RDD family membrane protein YckC
MIQAMTRLIPPLRGLPDPAREPAFYEGVATKRALAWVVDAGVTLLLCLLVLPFTAFTALFWWPVLWMVVGFLYRWATLAGGSATWGMRLMALTIRERDGSRLSGATALAHTVGYSVSLAVFPLQIISVGLMVALGRGQGLTDMILGTAAINRPG